MPYKCGKCNAEFDELPFGIIRCPSCAHKIFYKARSPVAKKIKAR